MHFQDRDLYGRIVRLQSVRREDRGRLWTRYHGDGIGEPVAAGQKPDVGKIWPVTISQSCDEFTSDRLGLQWHANPQSKWYSLNHANPGHMRLYTVQNLTQFGNLWFVPNLLLQKFSSPAFTATTKKAFHPDHVNDKSGLVGMGAGGPAFPFKTEEGVQLGLFIGHYEQGYDSTKLIESVKTKSSGKNSHTYFPRVEVIEGGESRFSHSQNGKKFKPVGEPFQAKKAVCGSEPRWGYSA